MGGRISRSSSSGCATRFVSIYCVEKAFVNAIPRGSRPLRERGHIAAKAARRRVDVLENQKIRPAAVIGPAGEELTLDNLPPPDTTRWVSRRKAQVVAAIEGGLLTADEACARYRMSREELANWQRLFDRVGVPGLRTTRIQYYREAFPAGYLSS